MYIQAVRLQDDSASTIGTLHVNGTFECFTLEDTFREVKIDGETRIPSGSYEIKLRTEGGMNGRYSKKYGSDHKGMLWLQDVPGFEWVYIHVGNFAKDTEGCLLVGTSCDSDKGNQSIGASVDAYKKLYAKVATAIESGEEVTIEII